MAQNLSLLRPDRGSVLPHAHGGAILRGRGEGCAREETGAEDGDGADRKARYRHSAYCPSYLPNSRVTWPPPWTLMIWPLIQLDAGEAR